MEHKWQEDTGDVMYKGVVQSVQGDLVFIRYAGDDDEYQFTMSELLTDIKDKSLKVTAPRVSKS